MLTREEINMSTFGKNNVSTSKKPQDTNFKQQKLPAWQPIITAKTILPLLFAVGLVFIPLGVALLVASNNISEIKIDYTDTACQSAELNDVTCLDFLKNNSGKTCECDVAFELKHNFTGPVYMYYGLTNFYQNHRRYVRSRDDHQLLGDKLDYYQLNHDCDPYRGEIMANGSVPYAPCGAIANSLFNDTFELFYVKEGAKHEVSLLNTGIAWSTDKTSKFNNPPGFAKNPAAAFNNTLHPPNWQKPIYQLDVHNVDNNGYENEDLMVWMRTAALPNFRKLYRKINATGAFQYGLPAGNYSLRINYSYPTWSFEGSKLVFLSTTSWMGGKNPFLGVAYLLVGSLCIVLGIIFLVIHLNFDRSKNIHDFDHLPGF